MDSSEEEVEEQSQSQSDDQFDPSDDGGRQSRKSIPRKPVVVGKRPPSKTFNARHQGGKSIPTFNSQTSPDETEHRLCQLFGPAFQEAAIDDCTLSDRLSVRDLRIIIRVLGLLAADAVNVRKPILCRALQEHFLSTHRQTVYG
jgi:hypothetical protein